MVKVKRDKKWQCYFCGCNNAAGVHTCVRCELKRVDTACVSAASVIKRHKSRMTAEKLALALLYDDVKHFTTGYDMQLGVDLARAVLKEAKRARKAREA